MDDQASDQTDRTPFVPTTTHAEWGAGNPRLRISDGDERATHDLVDDVTHIGGAEGGEIVLAGIAPLHATIEHDDRDEYVLTMHGDGELSANPDSEATHAGERTLTLRSGARFTAGPWTLVYLRDEYADHGRPFGGRQGGEGEHQRRQPDRPAYGASDAAASSTRD
ncbi:hypothetical protein P0L94_06695 [Microbacter sp. GSS18]|nr:hypothetical protein P0L94_06695 [Microbacter sp. GSS18]